MSDDEARMTFTEHLAELRTRIIRSGIAILACILVCLVGYDYLFQALIRPLRPLQEHGLLDSGKAAPEHSDTTPGQPPEKARSIRMVVMNPLEPIIVQFKLASYAGLALSLPFVVFQICAFVFPGLRPHERKAARILIFGSSALVVVGVSVAYFAVFPVVLPYLMTYAPANVEFTLRLNETVALILKVLAAFAIAFQFPMLVLVLVYLELLSPAVLRTHRKYAYVGLFVVAAVLTPPDPYSMLILGTPLVILYEVSIWISYLILRRKRRAATAAEAKV